MDVQTHVKQIVEVIVYLLAQKVAVWNVRAVANNNVQQVDVWTIARERVQEHVVKLVNICAATHVVAVVPLHARTRTDKQKITKNMTKKLVGQVTPEERTEIQTLFERRNGLNELAKILTVDNVELYEKLVKDIGETSTKFQRWWDRMADKYQWESAEGGNWEINFETCEIFLVS